MKARGDSSSDEPNLQLKFPSTNNFSGIPVAQQLLQFLFVWGFISVFIAMQTKTLQMPAVQKTTPRTLSRPLTKMLATYNLQHSSRKERECPPGFGQLLPLRVSLFITKLYGLRGASPGQTSVCCLHLATDS